MDRFAPAILKSLPIDIAVAPRVASGTIATRGELRRLCDEYEIPRPRAEDAAA